MPCWQLLPRLSPKLFRLYQHSCLRTYLPSTYRERIRPWVSHELFGVVCSSVLCGTIAVNTAALLLLSLLFLTGSTRFPASHMENCEQGTQPLQGFVSPPDK